MTLAFLRAVAASAAMFISVPALALSLSLQTPSQAPVVGETFAANVIVEGVDGATGLGFLDIDVVFDPDALRFESISLADALGSFADGDAIDTSLPAAPGLVNISILSLLDDFSFQPASFPIGTLFFTAVTAGTSELQFGFVALESGLGASFDYVATDASLTAVPLPAALWMFGPAVGLVGGYRRARQGQRFA
jgi:hypothetical protein